MLNTSFELQNRDQSNKHNNFSPHENIKQKNSHMENSFNLYKTTDGLNEINSQILQMKECKSLLDKEIREFPLSSFDYEIRIQELEDKIAEIYSRMSEIKENKDFALKKRILVDKEEEFLMLQQEISKLSDQRKNGQGLLASCQKDYINEKKQLEESLCKVQEKKLKINEELNLKIEKLNQLLEKKALSKEDLNGKLLQRAESIAQREELELFIESNENFEEYQLFENIKQYTEEEISIIPERNSLLQELNRQKGLLEEISRELNDKQDELHEVHYNQQRILREKPQKLANIRQENEVLEGKIEKMAQNLQIPRIESLFELLNRKNGFFLEIGILKRQKELIEQEEKNLVEIVTKEYKERQKEIENLKKNKVNDSKIHDLNKKNDELIKRKNERIKEIQIWKQGVQFYLQSKEEGEMQEDIKDLYSFQNFEVLLDEQVSKLNLNTEEYENFKDEIFQYLEFLQQGEKDLKEMDKVEEICRRQNFALLADLEKSTKEKKRLEGVIEEISQRFSSIQLKSQIVENEKQNCQKTLESILLKCAEEAFQTYMNEQSDTFNNIAKTYGANAAITLEKQHHNQFLSIYKNNRMAKLENIFQAKKNLKSMEFIIDYNMKNVDEEIIPNLREIVLKINEIKKIVVHLQSKQMKVIEREDRLMNELNIIQTEYRTKIKNIYENQECEEEVENRENQICYLEIKLQEIKSEIDRNFQDVDRDASFNEGELDEEYQSLEQSLILINEELLKTKILYQKLNEKTKNYEIISDKLTFLLRKKKNLEREINLMLSNPTDLPSSITERTKSQPKMRNQPNISLEKNQNFGLYTERNEFFEEENIQKLKNQLKAEKTKKSKRSKNISQDFTTKKNERTPDEKKRNATDISRSHCKNQKDCTRHQKSYRFDLEDATAKEIEILDNIRPLLEGIIVYKKFANYQSLKQPAFNPTNNALLPENCGYGLRMVTLNIFAEKLEFKSQTKVIETSILLDQIFKTQIPQITIDLIRNRKKLEEKKIKYLKDQKKLIFLPCSLVLEEGGRVELICRSEKDLVNFVGGLNTLMEVKKNISTLKDKIEVTCNCS